MLQEKTSDVARFSTIMDNINSMRQLQLVATACASTCFLLHL